MTALSRDQLDRLDKLLAKATPRPWRAKMPQQRQYRYVEFDRNGYTTTPLEPADARLIVEAVNALPALLLAAREAAGLGAENERMSAAIELVARKTDSFSPHEIRGWLREFRRKPFTNASDADLLAALATARETATRETA